MKRATSLMAILWMQPAPCEHRGNGETLRVNLDRVADAYRDVAKRFRAVVEKVTLDDPLNTPFNSGLPSCAGGGVRRVNVETLPASLVGKTFYFGAEAKGDLWIATRGRRLRDVTGAVLASPELAARLGLRCAPALVTIRSETEVDVVEE